MEYKLNFNGRTRLSYYRKGEVYQEFRAGDPLSWTGYRLVCKGVPTPSVRKSDGQHVVVHGIVQYATIDISIFPEHISVDARSRAVTAETSNIYLEDCEYQKGYCELQDKTFIWKVAKQVCYGFG